MVELVSHFTYLKDIFSMRQRLSSMQVYIIIFSLKSGLTNPNQHPHIRRYESSRSQKSNRRG